MQSIDYVFGVSKEQGAISADEFEARRPKGVQPTPSSGIGFTTKK
jgi:hypothetical protein